MNFGRMSLSQFFKKQSAVEIEIETEQTTVDPADPEVVPAPGAEESETETVETVTDPVIEEVADPENSAAEDVSAEETTDYQAIVQRITAELNLFGTTPEARNAFRSEAARNKGFIEAMKNVGVISDEDTTTFAQQETGLKSYEAAPWNKSAIAKRK